MWNYTEIRSDVAQQVLNPTLLNPTLQHATNEKQKLRCKSCAAETALQPSLFCSAGLVFTKSCAANKRKTALQYWKSCVAGKWRFPAAFLRISSSHVEAPTFRTCWVADVSDSPPNRQTVRWDTSRAYWPPKSFLCSLSLKTLTSCPFVLSDKCTSRDAFFLLFPR